MEIEEDQADVPQDKVDQKINDKKDMIFKPIDKQEDIKKFLNDVAK